MNYLLILIGILSVFFQLGENSPCNEEDYNTIKEFIQSLPVLKVPYSFKCSYTTIFLMDNYMGTSPEYLTMVRNYDFLYQSGNFLISTARTISPPPPPNNPPQNLLELLSIKLNPNSRSTNFREYTYMKNYYCFRGKGSNRTITIFKDGEIEIIDELSGSDFCGYASEGDPRINLGYVGYVLSNVASTGRLHLSQFLQEEGPYYLYEKDGYTVLWHEISFEKYLPMEERNDQKLSLEIWFDRNKDIKRIRQGVFPSRSYGLDVVRNIIGETASCDYPEDIRFEYHYHDYKTFEEGIRIPLRITVDVYGYDRTDPRYEQLWEKFKPQKPLAYYIKRATFNKKVSKNDIEIIIHEEGLEINKHIPEETFIAPPVTKEFNPIPTSDMELKKDNIKDYSAKNYRIFIFVGTCVFITIVAMFITHRYFGWGT